MQVLGGDGVRHHWAFKLPLAVDVVGKKNLLFAEICLILDGDELIVSFSRDLLQRRQSI